MHHTDLSRLKSSGPHRRGVAERRSHSKRGPEGFSSSAPSRFGPGRRHGQEGIVLLMVLLLVLMFTGLGLLAMRHTQGELRSAATFMDSIQATEAAQAAILMAAKDMTDNWDANHPCDNYRKRLWIDTPNGPVHATFSNRFNTSGDCGAVGEMPDPGLAGTAPLAATSELSTNTARVTLEYSNIVPAPPPTGANASGKEGIEGMDWFYVTVTAIANYGPDPTLFTNPNLVNEGRAVVTAHLKIGPVSN